MACYFLAAYVCKVIAFGDEEGMLLVKWKVSIKAYQRMVPSV